MSEPRIEPAPVDAGNTADVLKDEFARDMAGHQKRTGRMPTPAANQRLAASLFERMEAKRRDAKPVNAPAAAAKPAESQAEKRARSMGYKLVRLPDQGKQRTLKLDEGLARFMARLEERVMLLFTGRDLRGELPRGLWEGWHKERGPLNSPSWHERVLAAERTRRGPMGTLSPQEREEWRKRGVAELLQVCEDSSAVLGDWKKPPAQRLIIV